MIQLPTQEPSYSPGPSMKIHYALCNSPEDKGKVFGSQSELLATRDITNQRISPIGKLF